MILHNTRNKTLASDNINYNYRLYGKQKICTQKFEFCCSLRFVPLCFFSPGFSYEQNMTSCLEAYVKKHPRLGLALQPLKCLLTKSWLNLNQRLSCRFWYFLPPCLLSSFLDMYDVVMYKLALWSWKTNYIFAFVLLGRHKKNFQGSLIRKLLLNHGGCFNWQAAIKALMIAPLVYSPSIFNLRSWEIT